jgi:hypothetical protein
MGLDHEKSGVHEAVEGIPFTCAEQKRAMTQRRATRARVRDKSGAWPSNSLFICCDLYGYLGYSRFKLLGHRTGAQSRSTVLIAVLRYRTIYSVFKNTDFWDFDLS